MARRTHGSHNLNRLAIGFLAVAVLIADYFTGPQVRFPVLYILPVVFAAWRGTRLEAVVAAVALPLVRMWFHQLWRSSDALGYEMTNAGIEMATLTLLALLAAGVAEKERRLAEEVRVLRGLLPVCSFCKRIRDESGGWAQMESYITLHSEAMFTHTVCPECRRDHYGDLPGDAAAD